MIDKKTKQDLKNSWRNCNSATTGFLQSIPIEKLGDKPFQPRFTSFAWEFSCLLRTRYCYLEGLNTGKLSLADRQSIPSKDELTSEQKAQLADRLASTSREIIDEINKLDLTKMNMINWLLQHERIHHGKLILYLAKAGYSLPRLFVKTWGESNFKKPQ